MSFILCICYTCTNDHLDVNETLLWTQSCMVSRLRWWNWWSYNAWLV